MSARVTLITGAGKGIGRATAALLADQGYRVLAVSRTESDLRDLAATAPVEYLVGSVDTPTECAEIVAKTRERLGPIEVLVSNAGLDTGMERPIWEQDPDVWRRTMAVNADAAFHLLRLAARDMVERRWGRIVVVSSTAGQVGGARMSAYCASKHAALGLMRAAAQDLAPYGVTCNAVAPGWVRTPMSERTAELEAGRRGVPIDQVWAERVAPYPAGRIVTAKEVSAVIAFLVGDAASGINGETLAVALGSLW